MMVVNVTTLGGQFCACISSYALLKLELRQYDSMMVEYDITDGLYPYTFISWIVQCASLT
uniref:Uncharacterized protein n=1 Tax=Helianthus annuus TaxID=4232 RepID=A0A251U1I4_HELAN